MHLSMWSYPWDVQDQGLETTRRELQQQAGLNCISLATSYHAGRFLQARSPHRKAYFPQDGTIYFKPTPELWEGKEIRPLVADNLKERGDMLEALITQRNNEGDGDWKVSCWTVCLHNTRLGMLHPDHVTRNAFGDPNFYNLCPSSPAARDYVVTLVKDMTHTYKPDIVELESPCFMGFEHEFHHEKDGVGLNAEDDFLLSLCFCDHCMQRGIAAGVPMLDAKGEVLRLIEGLCEREVPEKQFDRFPQDGIDAFSEYPALHAFLKWRSEPVTSLIAEIRKQADPASQIWLIDLKDGWLGGVDLKAVGAICDGAILCCYFMPPEQVADLMEQGRDALGPDKYLGAGFRVFYPEIQSADALSERSRAAIEAGADGINYYNYGLIPQKRLDWVAQAVNYSATTSNDKNKA